MQNDYIIKLVQERITSLETDLEKAATNSKKRKFLTDLLELNRNVLFVLMNKPRLYH